LRNRGINSQTHSPGGSMRRFFMLQSFVLLNVAVG